MGDAKDSADDSSRQKAADRVGATVRAKWRLDKLIGFGGMAAVYAATHEDGHRAALKILHAELCNDDDVRERFLREGVVARRVAHPGVVRIFDDDVTDRGEPFLIMELLSGAPLSRVWRKRGKKIPLDASLHIAASVLDALTAFHDQNIVHRDLKPANIFITRQSKVKILDFGVAQLREKGRDMTRVGLAMGTPSYMAPEQALGKSDRVDHRADIYAVGATLYTILSGQRLHQGATEQESYVLAATQPASSVARVAPDLPVPVVALIDKALQWDMRNRFQSAAEMRDAILALDFKKPARPKVEMPRGDATPFVDEPSFDEHPSRSRSGSGFELDMDSGSSQLTSGTGVSLGLIRSGFDRTPSGSSDIELAIEPPGVRGQRSFVSGTAITNRPADRVSGTVSRSDDVPLPVDHPLAPAFVGLDRLLKTARQYGPSHPETQSRLQPVFEAFLEAVEHIPEGLRIKVLPFCFTHGTDTVWEPSPPSDIVPYTLSVAGLRAFHITAGVAEDELRELFTAMMVDASSNPSEIATALWEAPFQHIHCRIEEELGGEDAESLEGFFSEASVLEQELAQELTAVQKLTLSMDRGDVVEAAALAVMTGSAERSADMLRLPAEPRERLTAAVRLRASELRLRHDYLLLDAYADATARRDIRALAEALSSYSARMVRLGRDDELFASHRVLIDKATEAAAAGRRRVAASTITATLFPPSVLGHVVRTASGFSELLDEEQRRQALGAFALIANTASRSSLSSFLQLVSRVAEGPIFEHAARFIERVAAGAEETVIGELENMDPLVAQEILKRLLKRGPEVKEKLRPLLTSQNSALRCEAIAQLATSDIELTQELMKLFKGDDGQQRLAALDTFVRHEVRSAGPALVQLVQQEEFKLRPLDEQQKIFEAIFTLNPARSEALLAELVASHGLMRDDELERTRTLAARMLGERGSQPETLSAMRKATGRGWWNSPELREVAVLAARQIESRMGGAP
ncbi:MAG: serine/threonine protein kinase [Myxococcales bacterium]|nr:serine/threonine protein kinase [Myxococcales bacterium]